MDVAIIGSGLTGLAAAKKLLEAGHRVDIYEKHAQVGGVAASVDYEDTKLEIFYHHIFTSDAEVIGLVKELGLENELHWYQSKMGFYTNDKIYEFGTPISLLKFKPLNLVDKFRFGLSVIRLQMLNDWKKLEGITAKEWLLKNAGAKVYKICWEPLLRSKFGEKHDKVSMAWFWGKIKLRGSTRTEGQSKEMLGYMRGSFDKLIEKTEEKIIQLGGKFYFNSTVQEIKHQSNRVVFDSNGQLKEYDKVLLTMPLPVVPKMVPNLDQLYKEKLEKIEYTAVICAILKLKKSFSDIYWLNVGDASIPFGGLIEHTNMIKDPKYNEKKILYISNYTFVTDPLYSASDETVMKEYMKHLKKINPGFDENSIEDVKIFRAQYAQPIILCNYSQFKPDFKLPVSGVYMANMTHIYPEDRGMNYAIRTGYQVAEEMLK